MQLTALVPYYGRKSALLFVLHLVVTSFCAMQVGVNYYLVVRTSPGHPPNTNLTGEALEKMRAEIIASSLDRMNEHTRWCSRCDGVKPPRSHHCSVCGRCILAQDHHCPWVWNCVGFYNYRSFVFFVGWAALACGYVACCAALGLYAFPYAADDWASEGVKSGVVAALVLGGALSITLSGLFWWHVYLACTAQTTIEFLENSFRRQGSPSWRNPFDLGWKRNLISAWGPPGRFWLQWLNPWGKGRQGDGIVWKQRELKETIV